MTKYLCTISVSLPLKCAEHQEHYFNVLDRVFGLSKLPADYEADTGIKYNNGNGHTERNHGS